MDSRITQLILEAEEQIAAEQYDEALKNLAIAEQLDPKNKSIQMTRELLKSMQAERSKPSLFRRLFWTTR
jgi:hypothetical protein